MKWTLMKDPVSPPPPKENGYPQKKKLPPNRMDTPPKTILYTIHNYDTNIPPYCLNSKLEGGGDMLPQEIYKLLNCF